VKASILITLWSNARRGLAYYKATEGTLRKELADRLFPNPVKGTQYSEDKRIKLVQKLNYKLASRDQVLAMLERVTAEFPDVNFGDVIEWKPELKEKGFEALPHDAKLVFGEIVTITLAMPDLSLVNEP
jgi:hypothetical protein